MIRLLDSTHIKNEFDCGKELLNNYLKTQAGQDIKRNLSACFVFIEPQDNVIEGYYTLSNASISLENLPEDIRKKLPRSYTTIPATLLGRLAIDTKSQGKGLGNILLIDALKRSFEISKTIGSFAVIVDPIDKEAEKFYEKYGFLALPDSGKMFIAISTLKSLFQK